ncbi:MAG: dienelactone hydrolase family protein [Mucilaginibacter polytrichastri]|nr:dienelactone hydrolase family protein [Mucilaginibacter polytrichastri]
MALALGLGVSSCKKSEEAPLANTVEATSQTQEIDKLAESKIAFVSRTEGQSAMNLNKPTASIKRYLAFIPKGYNADKSKKWPLVIYLHDAYAKGTNIDAVKKAPLPKLSVSGKKDYKFLVISPQLEYNPSSWVTSDLNTMLTELLSTYNIDPKKIAITGEGLGGNGTWTWAIEKPTLFAAIAPIGGWSNPGQAKAIKNVPVWAFHGSEDFQGARSMVEALKSLGVKLKFNKYNQKGSELGDQIYANSGVMGWMFNILQTIKSTSTGGAVVPPVTTKPSDDNVEPTKPAPAPEPSTPVVTPTPTPVPAPAPAPQNPVFIKQTEGQTAHNLDNPLSSIRQYLAYVPSGYNSQPNKKWPVVIYLHGVSERGTDINKIFWSYFCWKTQDRKYPYILITPQLLSSKSSWDPADLDKMLDEVSKKYNIDPDRIILNGYSLGGNGVWKWAEYNPGRFAGMVATSGWGIVPEAHKLTNLPIQAFHGDADPTVKPAGSINMVNAIKEAGGNKVKLTLYPGAGHLIFDKVFGSNDDVVNWMLAQRRK